MGASALYHTVRCVSKWAEDNFLRIDLAGIVTMIIGSYIVAMGQGFTCIRSAFCMYFTKFCPDFLLTLCHTLAYFEFS